MSVKSLVVHDLRRSGWAERCRPGRGRCSHLEGILACQAVVHRPGSGRWVQRERRGREDAEGNGDERSLSAGGSRTRECAEVRSARWMLAAGKFRHLHYASAERCPTVQFDSTSNIGKAIIPIPPNVTLTPIHTSLAVKGPLGSTSVGVHSAHPLGWRRIQGSSRGRPERNDRWWEWTETQHETRTFAQHLRAYSIPHQGRSAVSH